MGECRTSDPPTIACLKPKERQPRIVCQQPAEEDSKEGSTREVILPINTCFEEVL
ncbi:hypothetical protein DPEC_G00201780 [Dallia pectoralis]|uniref:Uncharacterized protein n=1 Tax=Dallia pectoralis TaxID=75939 RepID=A0ACC2G9J9_DALPE|nr:hypothetical protein DPEC_G00201780 [Dallia pectoralis]